jgi:hypothetical protein
MVKAIALSLSPKASMTKTEDFFEGFEEKEVELITKLTHLCGSP